MELNISDLLDVLPEADVNIQSRIVASEIRIKELTMKKVHFSPRPRRGLGFIGKLLIAAAIIAALAVPVLAATGFSVSDWLEGLGKPAELGEINMTLEEDPNLNENVNYDEDMLYGANSKKWDASGWIVDLSTKDASPTGLTLHCTEIGSYGKSGALAVSDGFWLEKWNGSGYVPMDAALESDAVTVIQSDSSYQWSISWENVCGKLESGSYRLGKTFIHTADNGETTEYSFYAKFRVFAEDMKPYIEQSHALLDALKTRDVLHLTYTNYDAENRCDYAYYTSELWKYGDTYLEETRYINDDGSLKDRNGSMYRDGIGYILTWSGDDISSGVAYWETADFLSPESFTLQFGMLETLDALVGQVYVEDDRFSIMEYYEGANLDGLEDVPIEQILKDFPLINHDYTQREFAFDSEGRLTAVTITAQTAPECEESDKIVTHSLVVHDTPAEKIERVVDAQNVDSAPAFSWAEDQALFPVGSDSVITTGFTNRNPQAVESAQDAISIARAEIDPTRSPEVPAGAEFNLAIACHDKDAGMWKIQFSASQYYSTQTIYLDTRGITQLIVVQ